MKIIVNRESLLDVVNVARLAIPSRTPKPLLQCVHIKAESDKLEASGTDLEQYIHASTAMVQIEQAGESAVDAEKLAQILDRTDDDTVHIESDGRMMKVSTNDAAFKLYEQPAKDFPSEPTVYEPVVRNIAAGQLQTLFDRTGFAVANEKHRYAFNGILMVMDGPDVTAISTDGRRLAKASTVAERSDKKVNVILPIAVVKAFGSADIDADSVVTIEASENRLSFATDAVRISTALLEGQFPPYEDVIPKDCDRVATLPRQAFDRALRQAALMTNEESKGVRMEFTSKGLSIQSRSPEMGEATINFPCKYQGADIEIAFNPTFLIEAINACDADEITLSMTAPNWPGRIDAESYCSVLMPVNLM